MMSYVIRELLASRLRVIADWVENNFTKRGEEVLYLNEALEDILSQTEDEFPDIFGTEGFDHLLESATAAPHFHRLVQDQDCHWYVIPADKAEAFEAWVATEGMEEQPAWCRGIDAPTHLQLISWKTKDHL